MTRLARPDGWGWTNLVWLGTGLKGLFGKELQYPSRANRSFSFAPCPKPESKVEVRVFWRVIIPRMKWLPADSEWDAAGVYLWSPTRSWHPSSSPSDYVWKVLLLLFLSLVVHCLCVSDDRLSVCRLCLSFVLLSILPSLLKPVESQTAWYGATRLNDGSGKSATPEL